MKSAKLIRTIVMVAVCYVATASLGFAQGIEDLQRRVETAEARLKELEQAAEAAAKAAEAKSAEAKSTEGTKASASKSSDSKDKSSADKPAKPPAPKKWYERYTIRGYTQLRFNQELFERDPSAPAQSVGDRSIGDNQSFSLRRSRLILQGDINDHAGLYFQPDFASTITGSTDQTFYAQIRDAYADLYLDTAKVHRFRVGQSKVPYGWENLQSSGNRIPLDRADSLNSSFRNERDLGVFYYYTPQYAQDFFKETIDEGLKGSGNYGLFGIGIVNGQGGSQLEQNDNLHILSRLTLPYTNACGQRMEASIQGYVGEFVVQSAAIRPLGVGPQTFRPSGAGDTGNPNGSSDRRLATTWVWYPQPIGFQTEWNVGRGPALNASQTAIEDRALYGGYAMTMAKLDTDYGLIYPFARWSYHRGGLKNERNAPYAHINEWDFGQEWQFHSAAELVTTYTITDRTNTNATTDVNQSPYEQFRGHLLRMQLQFTY